MREALPQEGGITQELVEPIHLEISKKSFLESLHKPVRAALGGAIMFLGTGGITPSQIHAQELPDSGHELVLNPEQLDELQTLPEGIIISEETEIEGEVTPANDGILEEEPIEGFREALIEETSTEEEPVIIVEPIVEPTLEPTPTILTFEQKVAREKEIHPIYTQFLDADGILIKTPSTVNPQALQKEKEIIMLMTRHRPDIRVNIARTGSTYTRPDSHNETQIVIIPKNTSLTSLPEYTRYTGSDDKVRGLTGGGYIPFVLMSAVGEEDLLPSSKDNFTAYYEFAHVIQDGGITRDEWRRFGDIWFKYKSMFAKYTFITRDYAEFFSGLTCAYFGIAHGAIPTTAELKSVPEAYNFFASIYGPR